MSFLTPLALALAVLAVPIVALYMLRPRRMRRVVSSTMLWDQEGESASSAVPWQPLRWSWLLILQLLALALFVLLLARPFFAEESLLGPHTVLVIDTSGSMSGDRLQAAKTQALALAADASDENMISVVDGGPVARVALAFSADPDAVADAVSGLQATGGIDDLASAIRLARGLESPDRPTSLLIMSDGGDPQLSPIDEPIPNAAHLVFDQGGDNVAIAGLVADENVAGKVLVELGNHTTSSRDVVVELLVDGELAAREPITVGRLARARLVVTVDAGPGSVVTARLAAPSGAWEDALPLDDGASIVLAGDSLLQVDIAGESSLFLDALVASIPTLEQATTGEPDLTIADGVSVDVDGPVWMIAPALPPPGIDLRGVVRNTAVTYQRPGEPLLDGVDLSGLVVGEAQLVESTEWLTLAAAGDAPLILLGDIDGYRTVYFTFDITQSNLPVQVAFPVLGARIVNWLSGGSARALTAEPAGSPLFFVPPVGTTPLVVRPDGTTVDLPSPATVYSDTGVPGVYRVAYRAEDGAIEAGPVTVRFFAESESSLASREIATAAGPAAADGSAGRVIREWAPWLLGALLLLLVVEWWIAHQRPMLRRKQVAR
jgi:hypothetical protein